MYDYSAVVLKVVDGDTVHLDVDLGFDVRRKDSFRLYGIDAPEIRTEEGKAARQRLIEILEWIPDADVYCRVTTNKDRREKYGRYLATLWINQKNVNQLLVSEGFARTYDGGAR